MATIRNGIDTQRHAMAPIGSDRLRIAMKWQSCERRCNEEQRRGEADQSEAKAKKSLALHYNDTKSIQKGVFYMSEHTNQERVNSMARLLAALGKAPDAAVAVLAEKVEAYCEVEAAVRKYEKEGKAS